MFKFFRSNNKLEFEPKNVYGGAELYNSDIIFTLPPPPKPLYNFNRFNVFLNNIDNKIIDSVRVIDYGLEGEMYVPSLFFDGTKIIYVYDASKNRTPSNLSSITLYIGNKISKEVKGQYTIYYLETNKEKLKLFFIKN